MDFASQPLVKGWSYTPDRNTNQYFDIIGTNAVARNITVDSNGYVRWNANVDKDVDIIMDVTDSKNKVVLNKILLYNAGSYQLSLPYGSYKVNVKAVHKYTGQVFNSNIVDYTPITISLDKSQTTLINGRTLKLTAKTSRPSVVTWSSSNSSIASVDKYGTVIARKAGTATIYARVNGITQTCSIKVTNPVYASRITMNKTNVSMYRSTTLKLSASLYPTNTTERTIRWTSSNTRIASVDQSGVVTAKSVGTVYIYATSSNGKRTTSKVSVSNPIYATSITTNVSSKAITVGASYQLSARVNPTNTTYKQVRWSSNNTYVATVSSSGYVKAVAPGTLYISATTTNGKTTRVKITVLPIYPSKVTMNTTTKTLYEGSQFQLSSTISPSNATDKRISYSTSNSYIATVSSTGVIKAIRSGTVYIKARTSNGKSVQCKVQVNKVNQVSSIQLSKTSLELNVPQSLQLNASIYPSNATYKNVTWSRSNPNVASVSRFGKINAVSAGTAVIYAKSNNGKSASCIVYVTQHNVYVPDGYLSLTSLDGKYAIDVPQGNATNYMRFQLYENYNNNNQKWYLKNVGGNKFILQSALNLNKVMDVYHVNALYIYNGSPWTQALWKLARR